MTRVQEKKPWQPRSRGFHNKSHRILGRLLRRAVAWPGEQYRRQNRQPLSLKLPNSEANCHSVTVGMDIFSYRRHLR